MSLLGRIKWYLFALYITAFLVLPLALLWQETGAWTGLGLAAVLLAALRFKGQTKIAARLGTVPLTRAEAPYVHALLDEYCRRLGLTKPAVGLVESPSINFALFGFSSRRATLVLTRGALSQLKKAELASLLAHEITLLWHRDIGGDAWLSQFLWLIESLVGPSRSGRQYSFGFFVKQVLFYPLSLFPILLLKARRSPQDIDPRAARLAGDPQRLAEALRMVEAMKERVPMQCALNLRHLFFVPPPTTDPLVRILFDSQTLSQRIGALEQLVLSPST